MNKLCLTAYKRLPYASPKLPSATSFISKTLCTVIKELDKFMVIL